MSEALRAVGLLPLMRQTSGRAGIRVGLVDGPVRLDHAGLSRDRITALPGAAAIACERSESLACRHGTFVAGILSAIRGSAAPAICPGCTLLVRPIFLELTMTMPGFGAEASLERARGTYRGAATGSAAGDVRPMSAGSALGPFHWPVLRCCGWSSLLGRFVCVSHVRVPWEQCSCTRTPFGPVILCRPIDLSPA